MLIKLDTLSSPFEKKTKRLHFSYRVVLYFLAYNNVFSDYQFVMLGFEFPSTVDERSLLTLLSPAVRVCVKMICMEDFVFCMEGSYFAAVSAFSASAAYLLRIDVITRLGGWNTTWI